MYHAIVIAFQEKIPSVFKGCHGCYKAKNTRKYHLLKYFVFGGHDGTRPSFTLPVPSPSYLPVLVS